MASVIHATAHGLVAGDSIRFGNIVPTDTGIDETATYYVLASGLTADDFEFSDTLGGTPFALGSDITEGTIRFGDTYDAATGLMAAPPTPATPTGLAWSSTAVLNGDGSSSTRIDLTIDEPVDPQVRQTVITLTGGGNPILVVVPPDKTTASVENVLAATSYTAIAHAYDVYGNASAATANVTHTTVGDTTPPLQVTGLAAFGAILGLIATWNSSAATDLATYEVQVDTANTFATATTYRIRATVLALQQIAAGTYYFRVRAVDLSGNAGTYSSTVSATSRTVQTADLTDALITTAKIVAGAVTDTALAAAAVTAAKIATDAVTAVAIDAGAVGTSELAAGAVTAAKITAGTITSNEIAALTIVAANIAAGTIVASKIAAGTITANEIAALTIVAANIAAGTITGAKIAAGTITATNIAADTITANEIAASAITSSELAASAVIAGKIAAGTIATADLNASCSIQLVSNSGATVVIDSTGITITNGKLILQDEFGATSLGASGFSGSWSDFVMLGLYNGRLLQGVVGTVTNGRSSKLPYWTVSDPDAAAETLTYAATSPGTAKMTWGAITKRKRMVSDSVAVAPDSYYEIGVSAEMSHPTGQVQIDVTVFWYQADGVTASAATASAIVAQAQMLIDGARTEIAGSIQAPFDAAFAKVQVDGQEQTLHSALAYAAIRQVWLTKTPTHLGQINAVGAEVAGQVNAGAAILNSSGGLDPELSTAGNATIGGTLTITGTTTASGTLAASAARPGMVALPFVFTGTVTGTGDTTMFTSDAGVAMGSTRERYDVPWAGRIVGISLRDSASRTAGTLIGKATINGAAASPPTATVDGTHVDHRSAVSAYSAAAAFAADDGIGMIATGSGFTPTTNNLLGVVYVVFDKVG